MSSSDEPKGGGVVSLRASSKTRGLLIYWILDKCAPCGALKLQCNRADAGCGFLFYFLFSCTKTYSTKRICWQRWHSASKNETAKGNKRAGKALERNLWSSCSYKSPEIPTQTTARVRALKKKKKHTYFPTSLSLSVSHPHKHMYTAYRHTHTPNQWSSLGMARASEMRQRRKEEVEEGNKKQIYKARSSTSQQLHSPAPVTLYSGDTWIAHTLWCLFFSDVKEQTGGLAPRFALERTPRRGICRRMVQRKDTERFFHNPVSFLLFFCLVIIQKGRTHGASADRAKHPSQQLQLLILDKLAP